MALPLEPISSSIPTCAENVVQPAGIAKRKSDAAWVPRPLANVTPASVNVRPSPAACSPLDLSFSHGPQPFTGVPVGVKSDTYMVDVPPPPPPPDGAEALIVTVPE